MSTSLSRNRLSSLLPVTLPDFDDMFGHFMRPSDIAVWRAPASIWEADNTFHIEVDAPGVAKEDVAITFEDGSLNISLERKAPEGERTNWHNERGYGTITRSVKLPDTVDPDSISADLTNGVLHVTVTKRPEALPKRIDVRVS